MHIFRFWTNISWGIFLGPRGSLVLLSIFACPPSVCPQELFSLLLLLFLLSHLFLRHLLFLHFLLILLFLLLLLIGLLYVVNLANLCRTICSCLLYQGLGDAY